MHFYEFVVFGSVWVCDYVCMYVCMYVYVNGCVLSIYDDLFVAVHMSYMHVWTNT